ncbi:tyrosinase cofactor [Streptomyces sp. NBC_00237]|uniref:apotyrosinase chaperone MelC1 n=1 Tax=Streptomyces sp. NBC_00237 TaxID=2975687 RepID=UPI0022503456|nr:tyrosinase cofactor [Streptomyces sp. NBC_00237]MCX5205502.1 tyrosinase cofactor [Streptomyces sp. NBC_00237]
MSGITRRQAVKAATGAASGVALVCAATSWAANASTKNTSEAAPPNRSGDPQSFDEVFQGRRIQGRPAGGSGARMSEHAGHGGGYRVLIDGRELHVMHHEKSGWSSAINHYERFATPLDAARTAVVSLKGAFVVPFNPTA